MILMKLCRLHEIQHLPIGTGDAWKFFSDPRNLQQITPSWLNFRMTCDAPGKIYAGMILTYRITPVFGIPIKWVTEITHVREPCFFVDEQRFGPYKFWHHQHIFKETGNGVEMHDIVHYALPLGLFGSMVNHLFIKSKLNEIFAFRKATLAEMFGTGV
ncbi:SRPBCC family protein [Desulfococcaceae bacterium HSG8]|nr:SRPBCC family protein [Desulfococcaceae bacterium HSG8]